MTLPQYLFVDENTDIQQSYIQLIIITSYSNYLDTSNPLNHNKEINLIANVLPSLSPLKLKVDILCDKASLTSPLKALLIKNKEILISKQFAPTKQNIKNLIKEVIFSINLWSKTGEKNCRKWEKNW